MAARGRGSSVWFEASASQCCSGGPGASLSALQRIAYSSRSDDLYGRTWRRQQEVGRRAKLGPNWAWLKGIHEATRERLLDHLGCEGRVRSWQVRRGSLAFTGGGEACSN